MAIMYYILRRNLISLSLKHHPNPCSSSLCKTHLSFPFSSSSSAAAEENRVTVAEYLQQRHQFSPDALSKLVSSGKYLTNPENCDSVLSFFKEIGFSTTHLHEMVKRCPIFLSARLDLTIKPKIKLLQDAGLSPAEISHIVSTGPKILGCSTDIIGRRISEFNQFSECNPSLDLFRLLKKCKSTWFLTRDFTPNLELLFECGISSAQIVSHLHRCPRFFFQTHEHFKKCVQRVEEMGCDRTSKMFVHALRAVSEQSAENWERKLEVFRGLGFSEEDIRSVFRMSPHVFAISAGKIKESTNVLLRSRKADISLIVNTPWLLIYSVEKRVKPRLRVLEVLERKDLLKIKPSLHHFINMSNEDFLKKFVIPYFAEVGTIYCPLKGSSEET